MGPLPLTAHHRSCRCVTTLPSTMLQGTLPLLCLCSLLPGSHLLGHLHPEPLLDLLLHAHPHSPWLRGQQNLIDTTRLFAEHSIFIEYWFTVKDIRICCWSAKRKRKKKGEKIFPSVSFSVWLYLYHTCWVNIQWKDSELWGIETNQNDHLDTVAAFVCILLEMYLARTVVWLGVSDHSLITLAGTRASVASIAAAYKLVQHSSLRNLLFIFSNSTASRC